LSAQLGAGLLHELGDVHVEGLVFNLNDAFKLEDVLQQKVD